MAITITENLPLIGRRSFSAKEYDRLAELGFFDDEKLEPIEGEIIPKMLHSPPHAMGVWLAQTALLHVFQQGFMVRVQLPLALGPRSRPEPDVCVVQGQPEDFAQAHPTTAVLALEVSDSTLRQDRETKAALYARHGIAEYWIVNLIDNTLEVHRNPAAQVGALLGHAYTERRELRAGESIAPLLMPENLIAVEDLLP
jgi:Uma2 family endonuclease